MGVRLEDNSDKVKGAIRQAAVAFLHEACGELTSQGRNNQRVRTGKTKGSWRYVVDDGRLEGYVASDAMNAVYEEFGTGEYALNGDGRRGGWWYRDEKGKFHFTKGKRPQRPLYRAFIMLRHRIVSMAEERFKGLK